MDFHVKGNLVLGANSSRDRTPATGYWPARDAPPSARDWQRSAAAGRADRRALVRMLRDPRRDLLAPIPFAGGVTQLHEALLVADHNAYHVG